VFIFQTADAANLRPVGIN
jgi:hypothetical protein